MITTSSYINQVFKTEDHFTAVTNTWINHNYEKLRRYYYHIPNESESTRHHIKGVFTASDKWRIDQQSKGVLRGVPDFCFVWPYHWYLELKLPGGKLSPAQVSLHTHWKDKHIVIHTAYDARQVVDIMTGMIGEPLT